MPVKIEGQGEYHLGYLNDIAAACDILKYTVHGGWPRDAMSASWYANHVTLCEMSRYEGP